MRLAFLSGFLAVFAISAAACSPDSQTPWTESISDEILTTNQIYGASLPSKTVVFTYDDGPDEHTLTLARYLQSEGVKATFFVNGSRFCRAYDANGVCTMLPETRACDDGRMQAPVAMRKYYPESLLGELLALGHRIGNHTHDHCHLTGQTNVANLAFELKATQDILDKYICDGVFPFRAPFGEWNAQVVQRANQMMAFNKLVGPVNWEVDGGDYACWQTNATPESCATKYMNILTGRGQQNGIFLMHDRPEFSVGHEGPVLMTKILVPRLKAMGYRFGTLDQVLGVPARPDGGAACPPVPPPDGGAKDTVVATDTVVMPADATSDSFEAQDPADVGGETGGSSGAGGTPVSTGGAGGTVTQGSGGSGGSSAGSGGAGGTGPIITPEESAGCGCGVGAAPGGSPAAPLMMLLVGVGLAFSRRRRPRA